MAIPVQGKPFAAELASFNAEGEIGFHTETAQNTLTMAAGDLVCWGRCAELGKSATVVLADGSLLAADILSADSDRLTVHSPAFGEVKIPLELLAGIVFHAPSNLTERDRRFDRLFQATEESDRLFLENGDELAGQFLSIDQDTLNLDIHSRPTPIKLERIDALLFNPALKQKPTPSVDGHAYWLGLADGSRLLTSQFTMDADSARITLLGQSLVMGAGELVYLQPLGRRVVYLSDLKPAAYHQTPYLDLPWPYRCDRNVTGGMLRADGCLYLKGLGLHSAARIEFDLSAFRPSHDKLRPAKGAGAGQGSSQATTPRFQAELAIDDSANGQGSVIFRVFVDGREIFTSPVLHGGDKPIPVAIDLSNGKKLELQVDYADRADVLDRADWLNARITK